MWTARAAQARSWIGSSLATLAFAGAWGWFLYQGVVDPLGGINSLWPLFGIANQLLAAIALCLATTVILKMTLQRKADVPPASSSERETPNLETQPETGGMPVQRSPWLALVTLLPLVWLLSVTMTAGVQKIFDADPRIGFISGARAERDKLSAQVTNAKENYELPESKEFTRALPALQRKSDRIVFNLHLDAIVAGFFLVLVMLIVAISLREWILLLARKRLAILREAEPVWLPDYAVAEGRPLRIFSLLTLALALARELSGEAALDRAQQTASACDCGLPADHTVSLPGEQKVSTPPTTREQLYVQTVEKRFTGINRCC
jgi:carbon starvation protein